MATNRTPGEHSAETRETPLDSLASKCVLVVVALFVFTFIFQNFFIPSSSMASTLLVGDHVMVEREMLAPPASWAASLLPYREVKRGDIIVFYKPIEELNGGHMTLVKRVVGIPGDRIHLRNGIVYLNGVAQNEPQAAKPTYANYDAYVDDFPLMDGSNHPDVTAAWTAALPGYIHDGDVVVPPGKYFAMGDNRTNSEDSRYWGFVPRENIIGSPLLAYWSIATPESGVEEAPLAERAAATLHEFTHFFSDTRWRRTLHRVQ